MTATPRNNALRPLIFIPGIMGSELATIQPNGTLKNFFPPDFTLKNPPSGSAFKYAPDVIEREILPPLEIMLAGLSDPPPFNNTKKTNNLFPGAYQSLITNLQNWGYYLNENFWIYTYDWRKSNRENATLLKKFIDDQKIMTKPTWATGDWVLDIITHSMGNLIARAAIILEKINVNKMICIAPPYYGAPKAYFMMHPDIPYLTENWTSWVVVDVILPLLGQSDFQNKIKKIIQNFPSVFELFPDKTLIEERKEYLLEYDYYPAVIPGVPVVGQPPVTTTQIFTVQETYFEHPCQLTGDLAKKTQEAMQFKEDIKDLFSNTTFKPVNLLTIYSSSNSAGTAAWIRYVDVQNNPKMRKFGGTFTLDGDGSVTAMSAKSLDPRALNVLNVDASHCGLPNDPNTINEIKAFLQIP